MKCPHCGLINPNNAQNCDCGFNFKRNPIEQLYNRPQNLPNWVKTLLIIAVIVYMLSIILYSSAPLKGKLFVNVIFLILVIFSYNQLLQKKNWAIYLLALLTLPFGLLLLTSPEVKLYCFQKKVNNERKSDIK